MKKYLLYLLTILLVACGDNKKDSVKYDSSSLYNCKETYRITDDIPLDIELIDPDQLICINDTILAIKDFEKNGCYAHLITTKGKYLCSFGRKGKGKGEIISPQSISISEDGKYIYIYDYSLSQSVKYSISDLLAGKINGENVKYRNMLPPGVNRFNDVIHFSEIKFVGFGYNDLCRVINIDGGISHNYTDYPNVTDDIECVWSIWSNSAKYAISKDKKRIVVGTGIGMVFEIFNIDNNNIYSHIVKGFHKPVFGIASGAKPLCVTFVDETFEGFTTIFADNDVFYGCIRGEAPNYNSGNVIYCFNYNGKLVKKIKIDYQIVCLTVNENIIYIIIENEFGEYMLKKLYI